MIVARDLFTHRPLLIDPIMITLTRERAGKLTEEFADKRIVVLGDVMLDEFIWGRVRRISPEAPVPVVEVERETIALGGAGNVASNLIALGAMPRPLGVVGDDLNAERLRSAFRVREISADGLVIDTGRTTTLKTRIIAHNQQVVRADRESRSAISPETEERIISLFDTEVEAAHAVVVSDYNKGLLTPGLLARALEMAGSRSAIVCLDPKMRDFARYQPVTE